MSDQDKTDQIVEALTTAYWLEIETVINYIANSIDLDGVRAEEIKKSLAADVQAEIGHAQLLGNRIKTLGRTVPGSTAFMAIQGTLQPPRDTTDVVAVIKGVIDAEEGAIAQYKKIIALCEGIDYVTQDLVVTTLGDEEEHRRQFMGFLKEYERG